MSAQSIPSPAKRDTAIDTAKGLLMVLVVITHAGSDINKYLLWLHAPGFFLVSGFFFRPANTFSEVKRSAKRLIPIFFIPYLVYLFLFDAPMLLHYAGNANWNGLWNEVYTLLYGGRKLQGIYAAFWFIPVLFFSRMLVTLLSIYLKEKKIFITLLILFLLGSLESYYFHITNTRIDFPLNLDVVLTAGFYYFAGYLLRKHARAIDLKLYFAFILLCAMIVWGDASGFYSIAVDLKYSVYYQPLQALTVSILFPYVIYQTAVFIPGISIFEKVFSLIGFHSLTIMYLHVFVNIVIMLALDIRYNTFVFTIIGITIPLLFALSVSRWKLTRFIFMGSRDHL